MNTNLGLHLRSLFEMLVAAHWVTLNAPSTFHKGCSVCDRDSSVLGSRPRPPSSASSSCGQQPAGSGPAASGGRGPGRPARPPSPGTRAARHGTRRLVRGWPATPAIPAPAAPARRRTGHRRHSPRPGRWSGCAGPGDRQAAAAAAPRRPPGAPG